MTPAQEAVRRAAALAAPKPDLDRKEVVSARSRNSRTTVDPVTGRRITQLATGAINYRDAKGDWQPIDNTLAP